MKRFFLVPIVLVLVLAVTGCFTGRGPWDGEIRGTQIYWIDVQQSGQILTLTITVDETAKADVIAEMELEGKEYFEPTEMFIWMAPIITDLDAPKYPNSWGSLDDASWGGLPRFFPVARKPVAEGFTSLVVNINLGELARDGRAGLSIDRFGGQEEEWADWDDDMVGAYFYVSDGYGKFWEDWIQSDIDWVAPDDSEMTMDAYFDRSYPAGAGVSDVRIYPDTTLAEPESWEPFTLLGSGIYAPPEVRGYEEFTITLITDEWGATFGPGSQLWLNTSWGSFPLDYAAATSPEPNQFDWLVKIGPDVVDPDPLFTGVYIGNATPGSWIDMQFDWFWQDFRYLGLATPLVATDFDGGDVGMVGQINNSFTNYLNTDTEGYWRYFSYPPYEEFVEPDNTYNNWTIGTIDFPEFEYEGYTAFTNVLGVGSWGDDLNYNYDDNRNDMLIFPAYNYYSDLLATPGGKIYVSLMHRTEFDFNWYDGVEVQIEQLNWDGTFSYWSTFGWLDGPMDSWEREDNNGWRKVTWDLGDIWSGWFSGDTGSGSYGAQRIRLKFRSNEFNTYQGIMIDKFEVLMVE
jgi:hypothetical protein